MDRHLLFDGSLHSHQPDSELVLQQLADCADAAVAQMVDVIGVTDASPHLEHVSDHVDKIHRRQSLLINSVALRLSKFDVELQPPDAREVEFALVEEHASKQVPRG